MKQNEMIREREEREDNGEEMFIRALEDSMYSYGELEQKIYRGQILDEKSATGHLWKYNS